MPIVCIGISHRTAPVGVRERFALSHDDQRALFSRWDFDQLRQQTGIAELAVLSTCNRTEIYGAAAEPGFRFDEVPLELFDILAGERGIARDEVRPHIRGFSGREAVRHLCRVACGLDSMVLGESEVLGQVTAAHETAAEAGASGPLLEAVFQTAVRAGRRARAETGISRAPVSVSSVAVRAARDVVGDLADREILIVGTGKMGRLTGKFLRSNGASRLMVISRTRKHAEEVAARWGAEPLAWHDLSVAIARADVVFSSTAAPHAVITYELVRNAIGAAGRDRPLLFVDIAVPRDVEEEVRSLSNVRVLDIDHINTRVADNLAIRRQEIPRVETIVEEECSRFEEWRHAAELRPVLSAMRARSEAIREAEVSQLLRRLSDLSPEAQAEIQRFSRSLVNKLLHGPTLTLRRETDPKRSDTYVQVTRALFGLSDDGAEGVARKRTA